MDVRLWELWKLFEKATHCHFSRIMLTETLIEQVVNRNGQSNTVCKFIEIIYIYIQSCLQITEFLRYIQAICIPMLMYLWGRWSNSAYGFWFARNLKLLLLEMTVQKGSPMLSWCSSIDLSRGFTVVILRNSNLLQNGTCNSNKNLARQFLNVHQFQSKCCNSYMTWFIMTKLCVGTGSCVYRKC